MNEKIFDFEKEQPPHLTAKELYKENERRKLIKQIKLLKIAAVIMALCILLFAFFIAQKSFVVSIICIVFLCVSLSGYIIIGALFFKKGYIPDTK